MVMGVPCIDELHLCPLHSSPTEQLKDHPGSWGCSIPITTNSVDISSKSPT